MSGNYNFDGTYELNNNCCNLWFPEWMDLSSIIILGSVPKIVYLSEKNLLVFSIKMQGVWYWIVGKILIYKLTLKNNQMLQGAFHVP